MEDYFKVLVGSDSLEEWAKLKRQMPWSLALSNDERKYVELLGLEKIDIDTFDEKQVTDLIENSPDGTIFGEFIVDPGITINNDFLPYVLTCHMLFPSRQGSTFSVIDLVDVYRSQNPNVVESFAPVTYMAIVCPRCQLKFTEGEEDLDFSPEDCVFKDCFVCGGSGEWQFDLLSKLADIYPIDASATPANTSSTHANLARFCTQCGNAFIDDSQRFCPQCGARRNVQ